MPGEAVVEQLLDEGDVGHVEAVGPSPQLQLDVAQLGQELEARGRGQEARVEQLELEPQVVQPGLDWQLGPELADDGLEVHLVVAGVVEDVDGGRGDQLRVVEELVHQELDAPLGHVGGPAAHQHPEEAGGVKPARVGAFR